MTTYAPQAALPSRRDVLGGLAAATATALALGGCGGIAEQREDRIESGTPPIGRIIRVNGRKVHVWVEGSGPDVVLIHGGASNLRDLVEPLLAAPDCEVIVVNGGSTDGTPELACYPWNEQPRATDECGNGTGSW